MAESIGVFGLGLTERDRGQIRALDEGHALVLDHHGLGTVRLLLDRIEGETDARSPPARSGAVAPRAYRERIGSTTPPPRQASPS